MEQISENKNVLFKRQELVFETDKNMTFDEARKEVAENIGKTEEVINVRNVKGGFGNQKFIVSANVYDNKEDLEIMTNMELSKKKKKEITEAATKAEEEAKAEAEKPAEEAAPAEDGEDKPIEEATVEEKVEEAVVDEKKGEDKPVEEVKEVTGEKTE